MMSRAARTGFWACTIYMSFLGVASFLLGRLLPKEWFLFDRFPYRPFSWEKTGRIYVKLGIRLWKDKVPDMSRIVPRLIPSKRLPDRLTAAGVYHMLQETCVAEFIHGALCLAGLFCLYLWQGIGGVVMTALYILLGNLPFVLIQRYNRPKLMRLYHQLCSKERQRTERSA